MKIIITERQFKLIERVIDNEVFCDKCNWNWSLDDGGNDPFICHKCGHDNEPKPEPNVFTYTTLGSFNLYKSKFKYFNNIEPVKYDPSIPNKVKLIQINDDEIYIVDKSEFTIWDSTKYPGNKNGRITDEYFLKTFSQKQNNNISDIKVKPTSELLGITPYNIRLALKNAYPNNWVVDNNGLFSPGLRGVETIGSYSTPPTDESWSILNFFDTKKEVQDALKTQYLLEKSNENIVEWLTKIFNPDKVTDKVEKVSREKILKKLIELQIDSFIDGFNRESESVTFFLRTLPPNSKVTTYPPGSKIDRYCGVDVTINGVNYQIKPLSKVLTNKKGQTVIYTYNMKDYKDKVRTVDKYDKVICPGVDKIAFSNSEQSIVFDNNNYEVPSKKVTKFNKQNQPIIYK